MKSSQALAHSPQSLLARFRPQLRQFIGLRHLGAHTQVDVYKFVILILLKMLNCTQHKSQLCCIGVAGWWGGGASLLPFVAQGG